MPVLGDVALGLVNATLAVGLVASVVYLTAPEGAASSSRPLAGRRKRWGPIGTVGADPRATPLATLPTRGRPSSTRKGDLFDRDRSGAGGGRPQEQLEQVEPQSSRHRFSARMRIAVTASERSREPRQPKRLLKKKNTCGSCSVGAGRRPGSWPVRARTPRGQTGTPGKHLKGWVAVRGPGGDTGRSAK